MGDACWALGEPSEEWGCHKEVPQVLPVTRLTVKQGRVDKYVAILMSSSIFNLQPVTPYSQSKMKTRNQEILNNAVPGDLPPGTEKTVMDCRGNPLLDGR